MNSTTLYITSYDSANKIKACRFIRNAHRAVYGPESDLTLGATLRLLNNWPISGIKLNVPEHLLNLIVQSARDAKVVVLDPEGELTWGEVA